MREMIDLGFVPVRRVNGRGGYAPHLSLQFGKHLFSIDTSRSPKRSVQPETYLITHAHSDHYGKSAMLSERAVASVETARALEIRYGRKYKGSTFAVGDDISIGGVSVSTYSTGHTVGSVAFSWENEIGTRVLVTGDVKDYSSLPRADLIVAEANYGDPWDPACKFDDDLAGFWDALQGGASFGAYAFGKAQRAVALIRGMGYEGDIGMDSESLALTREFMPGSGPLVDLEEGHRETNVVTPRNLSRIPTRNKYFLTCRNDLPYGTIRLSDHLDFRGLMRMFEHVSPGAAIIYHPEGQRARCLAFHLQEWGIHTLSLDRVRNFVR